MTTNNTNKNNQQTVYANGTWVRSKTFENGDQILKVSILVDKFIDFLKEHKKEDGFVNLVLSPKRTPDEISSHSVKLDSWVKPASSSGAKTVVQKTVVKPTNQQQKSISNPVPQDTQEESDLF